MSSPARVPRAAPVEDFQGPRKAKGASPPHPVRQQEYGLRGGGARGESPPGPGRQKEYGSRGGARPSGSPLPTGGADWRCCAVVYEM